MLHDLNGSFNGTQQDQPKDSLQTSAHRRTRALQQLLDEATNVANVLHEGRPTPVDLLLLLASRKEMKREFTKAVS